MKPVTLTILTSIAFIAAAIVAWLLVDHNRIVKAEQRMQAASDSELARRYADEALADALNKLKAGASAVPAHAVAVEGQIPPSMGKGTADDDILAGVPTPGQKEVPTRRDPGQGEDVDHTIKIVQPGIPGQ